MNNYNAAKLYATIIGPLWRLGPYLVYWGSCRIFIKTTTMIAVVAEFERKVQKYKKVSLAINKSAMSRLEYSIHEMDFFVLLFKSGRRVGITANVFLL
jgi:hypothetical protein